ncbi:MAG: bifunctional DNA-formamidopyrimidine glycosylase/DNA-(apurinic or apyrimidinic site) lyase [Chloroflexi bacterium]|nr:bifunctional DNA-formamidopyrimidine glycosylase/DNA-(apurinic or apyrimidinic site) lyase [Chloroflexota bacterium]
MPELPEVETIRRDLAPLLVGRTLTAVRIHAGAERLAITHAPAALARELSGRRVDDLARHGKYLLARLDDGRTWVLHLRMTGSIVHTTATAQAGRFERARVDLDDGHSLRLNDMRKFATWHLVADPREAMPNTGPDALDAEFSPAWLAARLATRTAPVKAVLLDQAVAAGVGNIYADEACWIAGIDPRTPADAVGPRRAARLHAAVCETLEEALGDRGSSFSDYRDGLGAQGLHQVRVHVFRRDGEPCDRCGSPIVKTRVAGRGTHLCPGCQRRPRRGSSRSSRSSRSSAG